MKSVYDPAAIETLPPLREVIRAHDLRAEKKLGQNFLLDLNLTAKIVRQAGDLTGKTVFEIGPGPGGLTRPLVLSGARQVVALEYDPRAVAALQGLADASAGRLSIRPCDALETDLTTLGPSPRAIVANLPYNIATPLLISWLRQIRLDKTAYDSMTLMFQKEVADRLTARPNTKAYGRLSVLAQWLCDVRPVLDIPPAAFTPPPKVVSTVVHLVPKTLPDGAPDFAAIEAVTAAAFGQRRKMIRTSLKAYADRLDRMGINLQNRAEDLSVEAFVKIAGAV